MKQQFSVYMVDHLVYGDGRRDEHKTFIGKTFATSKAKAVSNIKYREGYRDSDLYCDWSDGGCRQSELIAVES